MPLKKCSHVDASSFNPPSGQNDSLNDCFRNSEERTHFFTYFVSWKVNVSRPLDLDSLTYFNFAYLQNLNDWQWINFFKIHSSTHANLVRAFHSNSLLEHSTTSESVVAVKSYILNTLIQLTLECFGKFSKLPSGGESNEKRPSKSALIIASSYPSKLNLHDWFLYLILTLILCPISKHVVLRAIDYWWLDCF